MKKTRKPRQRNPMVQDLWKPKYGLRVIKRKDKTLHRKRKHKSV